MIYTIAAQLGRWSPRETAVNALLKRAVAEREGGREHENFIKNANKRAATVHEHGVGDSVLNELVDCASVGISSGAEKCGCEDVVAVGHLTTRSHVTHDTPHIVQTRRPASQRQVCSPNTRSRQRRASRAVARAPWTKLRQSRTHPGSCRNPALWLRERTVTESIDLLAVVKSCR
jgi:hypothetical protein